MILETKYGLGDKVYFIKSSEREIVEEECPFCKGFGAAHVHGCHIECKTCSGSGRITRYITKEAAKRVDGIVRYVDCSLNLRGEKRVYYKLNIDGKDTYVSFDEEELHSDV